MPILCGWLLALVQREIYIRHPLPLGGTVVTWEQFLNGGVDIPKTRIAYPESGDFAEGVLDSIIQSEQESSAHGLPGQETFEHETADKPIVQEAVDDAENAAMQSFDFGASPFDESQNRPQDWNINEVLDSMVKDTATSLPSNLEHRIEEEAAHSETEMPLNIDILDNNLDDDDLQALVEALPTTNIDFTQDLDESPDNSDAISPMAKDVLGENFDFETLEQQAKESMQSLHDKSAVDDETDSATRAIDIREDGAGTVQASSPAMFDAIPQLTDFAVPETILPTFSSDWIQGADAVIETIEGDASKFCFNEESQPMFVRKKGKVP